MLSFLVDRGAFPDTDPRPEANGSSQPEQLKGNIAMNTLFDDIATTIITAAFAIASASGMIAMFASAL